MTIPGNNTVLFIGFLFNCRYCLRGITEHLLAVLHRHYGLWVFEYSINVHWCIIEVVSRYQIPIDDDWPAISIAAGMALAIS